MMYNVTAVNKDITYIGASDRRLELFENMYPLTNGVSYNSYFVDDDKTVVLDTVDQSVSKVFLENIQHMLNGRNLDYIIVNHMEPDHCATLGELLLRHPETVVVANAIVHKMIGQFFDIDIENRFQTVAEGDTLTTGRHTFTFVMAPMVHWPEVMVTYDTVDKVLFSADAFGTFGALAGNIFADETDFKNTGLTEARRYYTNIVGKYGVQVQNLLKKAATLDIQMICPLHGPIWRNELTWFIDKYNKWSTYTPEDKTVMIAYASIYGGTENAADILASQLAANGVKNIVMYDVSKTHLSYIIAEAFRCSHIVFASPTYNMGIFTNMETVLLDLAAHNLSNRTVAIVENGSWATVSGKLMRAILDKMKNITIVDSTVSLRSTVKEEQRESLKNLADELTKTIL